MEISKELEGLELGNDQAYDKVEFYGQQGSGKTTTASLCAIGMHGYIKSQKPVFFHDTETGSSFVKHLFDEAGIKLVGKRSKTFADLMEAAQIAQRNCDIMLVDSITHIWVDLCESYRKKKYLCEKCNGTGKIGEKDCFKCEGSGTWRDRLSMYDYQPIKKEWAKWVDFFLNSKLHLYVCGRAGGKYESRENLEGQTEIMKVDEVLKAESEFGYEASLLIQMKPIKTKKGIENTAFVWKDKFRNSGLNGKEIKMPKFEDFLPHVQLLNIGGLHIGTTDGKDTLEMLKTPHGSSEEYTRQKTIVLEEIQAAMTLKWPSSGTEDKKAKMEALNTVFGTLSWTAVESMKLEQLMEGQSRMLVYIETFKSEPNNGKVKKELVKGGSK